MYLSYTNGILIWHTLEIRDYELNLQDLHSKRITTFFGLSVWYQFSWIKLIGSLRTYLGSSYLAPAIVIYEQDKLWKIILFIYFKKE